MFLFLLIGLLGKYIPQYDASGQLLPRQCWASTGTCWCVSDPMDTFPYSDTRVCNTLLT